MEPNDLGTNWEGFIKMLLHRLDIPSKEDIAQLHTRLDKLEQLIYQKQPLGKKNEQQKPAKKKVLRPLSWKSLPIIPTAPILKPLRRPPGLMTRN